MVATNNVAREQDNASKEKAKTMVEELQCKSLTAPESDTVQQDWAAHRATWLDQTSNALPHHRKGKESEGKERKMGLRRTSSRATRNLEAMLSLRLLANPSKT